jgi:hypothetical protein
MFDFLAVTMVNTMTDDELRRFELDGVESPVDEFVKKIIHDMEAVADEDMEFSEIADVIADMMDALLGLPGTTGVNFVEGVQEFGDGEWWDGFRRMMGWSEFAIEN